MRFCTAFLDHLSFSVWSRSIITPFMLPAAGSHDRALPSPVKPSHGAISTAADAEAGQPSAAAAGAKPLCPSLSPLTKPTTPAASVDDPKTACGWNAPSAAHAAPENPHAAQSVQAKQLQRRQAVARFKVRLLERAPSPAPAPRRPDRPAQPTADPAATVQSDADAAATAVALQAVAAAMPLNTSVLGRQLRKGLFPFSSALGQSNPQAVAKPDAPTANGAHGPAAAASPVVLLPAPDAPLSAVLPPATVVPPRSGPAPPLRDPLTLSKAALDGPSVPQVLLRSRLAYGHLRQEFGCHHACSTTARNDMMYRMASRLRLGIVPLA